MKIYIRENTFETNSSSTHSLSINKSKPIEIKKDKDVCIDPKIDIHYIGGTSCYVHTSKGSYAKAQSVLRFMGYELEEQLDDLIQDQEWETTTIRNKILKEKLYEAPMIKAFVKAIKKYIGEEYNVTIVTQDEYQIIETVIDYDKSVAQIFGVTDLTDVDTLADRFYEIIFDDNIEITEECESND